MTSILQLHTAVTAHRKQVLKITHCSYATLCWLPQIIRLLHCPILVSIWQWNVHISVLDGVWDRCTVGFVRLVYWLTSINLLWLASLKIGWGCLSRNGLWPGSCYHWKFPPFSKATETLLAQPLPAVWVVQRDCERVYQITDDLVDTWRNTESPAKTLAIVQYSNWVYSIPYLPKPHSIFYHFSSLRFQGSWNFHS